MISGLGPKVLVVDDEPSVCKFLKEALRPVAASVTEANTVEKALELIAGSDYDVVLLDVFLPGTSRMDLLKIAQQSEWDLALILISGSPSVEIVVNAFRGQAADFLVKPFSTRDLVACVAKNYERLVNRREARTYQISLENSILRRTRELEQALWQVEENDQVTLEALVAALDAREHETYAHSFRVRAYTICLAQQLGYPPAQFAVLEQAALLHDIGKIAVSDTILLKPGKLTAEEWAEMRKHSVAGSQILSRIPFLRSAALIVHHHHERYDGSGYPDNLAGDSIPLGSRVFALADTLDAMTSDRVYRKAPGLPAAREEIQRCSGGQFDPRIVEVFLAISEEKWIQLREEVAKRSSSTNSPFTFEAARLTS